MPRGNRQKTIRYILMQSKSILYVLFSLVLRKHFNHRTNYRIFCVIMFYMILFPLFCPLSEFVMSCGKISHKGNFKGKFTCYKFSVFKGLRIFNTNIMADVSLKNHSIIIEICRKEECHSFRRIYERVIIFTHSSL